MKPIYPFTPYKIDDEFGTIRSKNYAHEGLDLNGVNGGNTDCGTPLKAVAEGEIIHCSESTRDYGNLIILMVKWGAKTYFIRYAHCQSFLAREGQVVAQGQVIAKMGSTGNSTACHLHLDVLKKQPSNWRYYPRNVTQLHEYFVNPVYFFNGALFQGEPKETMPERKYESDAWIDEQIKFLSEARAENVQLKETIKDLDVRLEELNTRLENSVTKDHRDRQLKELEKKHEEEILQLSTKNANYSMSNKQLAEEISRLKDELLIQGKPIKDVILRYTSRKFIISILAFIVPILNAVFDFGLDAGQIVTIITPMMLFIGAEGWKDVVQAKQEGAL